MRQLPPRRPKGSPRVPGSGRRPGSPNRKTVELRQLMSALAGDIDYQARFSRAFRRRTLAPQTEMRVWEYVVGKPAERVQLAADVTMHQQQLEEERQLFLRLSPEELQELADDNARLLEKARRMVQGLGPPANATGPPATDRAGIGEAAAAAPPGTDIDDT